MLSALGIPSVHHLAVIGAELQSYGSVSENEAPSFPQPNWFSCVGLIFCVSMLRVQGQVLFFPYKVSFLQFTELSKRYYWYIIPIVVIYYINNVQGCNVEINSRRSWHVYILDRILCSCLLSFSENNKLFTLTSIHNLQFLAFWDDSMLSIKCVGLQDNTGTISAQVIFLKCL